MVEIIFERHVDAEDREDAAGGLVGCPHDQLAENRN